MSLSQDHPLLDGNKRTAITATAVFLRLNGFALEFNDVDAYRWFIQLYETGRVNKANIEPWLGSHTRGN